MMLSRCASDTNPTTHNLEILLKGRFDMIILKGLKHALTRFEYLEMTARQGGFFASRVLILHAIEARDQ